MGKTLERAILDGPIEIAFPAAQKFRHDGCCFFGKLINEEMPTGYRRRCDVCAACAPSLSNVEALVHRACTSLGSEANG